MKARDEEAGAHEDPERIQLLRQERKVLRGLEKQRAKKRKKEKAEEREKVESQKKKQRDEKGL
tara:strand:+ start:320 stop:508 length:189 start_codon:yes stop_codon:yes gene_type:complete